MIFHIQKVQHGISSNFGNVSAVEMEGASIGAVCQYTNLDYFTFYYAGDNLDAIEWDARSLSQLINFDKKVKVPALALELAYKIAKNN